jgi:hypothetical protein
MHPNYHDIRNSLSHKKEGRISPVLVLSGGVIALKLYI